MKTSKFQRILSALLALCLTIGLMVPVFATEELSVSDYTTFVKELKVLEGYAESYAAENGGDANELVLNFVRTGVERYNDGNWVTLAGPEKTAFVNYVAEQDTANGTTAMRLRNILISNFKLPNGDQVDFGHMFGTMNIAYLTAVASADLGGWAGDLCDLLRYSKFDTTVPAGTIEEMTAYVLENCFLVDADQAFGMDDFCGDLDAFYLNAEVKKGGKLSDLMDAYFTADLNNADRSAYFMNNRFKGLETREDVREAILEAYTSNIGLSVLEADRGLSGETDLRIACCYAFADYLFDLAGDRLEGDTGSGDEGGDEGGEEDTGNGYYSIFSSTDSNLAPGVSQSINYAYTADDKQIAFYVATVDVNRDDVSIFANYKDHNPGDGWGLSRVRDQMLAAQAFHSNPADPENYIANYNVVAGVNGDFYNMSTGRPSGPLVMHGTSYHPNNNRCFFAMLKDGSAVIGSGSEWATYADRVQESVGGSAVIVRNGEIAVSKSDTYYNNRASRTAVGITAEGKVVLMVLDGRQEPFSAGGSLEEIAQIMIDAGCVIAMNLDGGGSSTFVSKAEGSDEIEVVNSPSDGFARSVSSSLVVVSTALVSKEFDHANIITDYDYVTPYTPMELKTVGVSISGHAATIPETAVWQVSDENVGYIEDGVFYGIAELDEENREQTVDVQLVDNGKVIGSKTMHVVLPTEMEFVDDRITAIFGQPTTIGVKALYNDNPVAYNEMDIILFTENGGECVGFDFIGDETSGLRVATVYAALLPYGDVIISTKVQMYREDEAMFDFENLTGGDRQFGWIRDITNTYTYDDVTYLIQEAGKGMNLSYIFGLDMEAIDIPEQLADLTYMLPGADAEDACAWNFLLQLAERVSVLTTVQVTAQFDMDLDVDISELTFNNEYFYMKDAVLDEATNTLTITCGWYDQTAAIDPATANPICILSGLKATPKEGNWNGDMMTITNMGDVKYDIYLRANALYSFALDEANQKTFGLYPFENKDVIIANATEKGAYFSSTYATFQDSFILDRTDRDGWYATENNLYYYVDNKVITGTHKLPGYEDPANLYYYTFDEDGVCTGTVTGLFRLEDGLHYAVAGEPKTGWHTVTTKGVTNYYYFYPSTGVAADGVQTIDGFTYTFTDCILTRGHLVVNDRGTLYRWAGEWMSEGWLELDGKIAFVQRSGYFATGLRKLYYTDGKIYYFAFGEDGFLMSDFSGFYDYNGGTYLIDKGHVVVYPGLVKVGEDYYYFTSKDTMVKNCTYWVSKNNGYVTNGNYVFGPDGKMVMDGVKPSEPSTKPTEPGVVLNGIVKESEETWYYYVDGVKTYAGVIEIDGAYYYVNSKGLVIHNQVYWVSKNNGYVKNGNYTFDAEGKMVQETTPTTPTTKPTEPGVALNGIVKESEETWYYYVDGVKTYAGVIEIDGAYYYVNSKGLVIHNQVYWVSKNNGYVKNGNYTFDAEGKMVQETTPTTPTTKPTEPKPVLNGIVKESEDVWYYYVDGVKTYAGVIEIDGAYYYVNSKCLVIHNQVYWVSKNNGYVKNGNYTFDAEGKMVL